MRVRKTMVGFLGILLLFLLAEPVACAGELIVIANNSVPVDSLDRTTISNIYMGNKTKWDNGETIRVVMLKKGPTHEMFAREIVGTTPAKLKNLWKKAIFGGTGRPPKIFKTDAEVIEYVASTGGAIGYVDAASSHGEAKVILINP